MLEYHADAEPARMVRVLHDDRLALPADLAGVGLQHAIDDLDQGALAGAVLAEQGMDLTRQHRQVDAIVGQTTGKLLHDAAERQERDWSPRRPVRFRLPCHVPLCLCCRFTGRDAGSHPAPRCFPVDCSLSTLLCCTAGSASNCAAVATAIAMGCLPGIWARPIGQTSRSSIAGAWPRPLSALRNRAFLVALPIRPRNAKSPRRSTRSQMSRSSWCECVRTRNSVPAGAFSTASANRGATTCPTPAGICSGNPSNRLSSQVTSNGRSASTLASARPTWPAPNSHSGRDRRRTASMTCQRLPSSTMRAPSALSAASTQLLAPSLAVDSRRVPSPLTCDCHCVSQRRSILLSGSSSRRTAPPQHCPRSGPSE